jgi:hypothetical protein
MLESFAIDAKEDYYDLTEKDYTAKKGEGEKKVKADWTEALKKLVPVTEDALTTHLNAH